MVFITDSGDVSTVVQAMRDGAVDFLMKPIEADQLIAAVTSRPAERHRSRDEAASA
jgi:FixJ family two-component response regulator